MDTAVAAPPEPTTQSQASGSSFYAAMRLLPRAEREGMFAVYAWCRVIDDIADEPGPTNAERHQLLDAWRADLDLLYAGKPPERTNSLIEPVRRFGLNKDDFIAVIDGMEMDIDHPIQAPSFEVLDLYCDRVASAVGRLSVRIFGMNDDPGLELSHHLGRALQFTNILRDLDEDAAMGRLYLPLEALEEAEITSRDPHEVVSHPAIDHACRWLAKAAHEHYAHADRILSKRPPGKLRSPRLMGAVYSEILSRMEAVGWSAPRTRVKVGKARLLWIVLRRGLME